MTSEYDLGELAVTIEPDGEYFNIIKVELYCHESREYLDITKVKSEKLTNYILEKVNILRADESVCEAI